MGRLIRLFLTIALACAAQSRTNEDRTKARDLLVTVLRVFRLSTVEQDREIPRIYRDVWPALKYYFAQLPSARLGPDDPSVPPEEMADRYERLHNIGWTMVFRAAHVRCRQLLAAHPKQVEQLAREDLSSTDPKIAARGLRAVGEFRISALFDAVIAQLDGPEADVAYVTLDALDDPRAIPAVVLHAGAHKLSQLQRLQLGRPADPELVAALDDPDADVRYGAAFALVGSGDPRLVPVIERIAQHDQSPKVRVRAVDIAFEMAPHAYTRLRPVLVGLLADPSIEVKAEVAIQFARRSDSTCLQALYELLENEEKLDPPLHNDVVVAVLTITGSYFGFAPNTISAEPARRASLARFADWIAHHPARWPSSSDDEDGDGSVWDDRARACEGHGR